jgi:hypothetical protein
MRLFAIGAAAAAVFAFSPASEAAIVSVTTPDSDIAVGETLAVDFSFTAEDDDETLIAYLLDIVWSGERLSPIGAEFSPGGSNPLDPEGVAGPDDFAFFSFDGFGLLSGTVPEETAQETAAAAQADSFTFARLLFESVAPGPAVVGLASAMGFGGIDLAALNPTLSPQGIEIAIGPVDAVPLPGAAVLMGGVLGAFGVRRWAGSGIGSRQKARIPA